MDELVSSWTLLMVWSYDPWLYKACSQLDQSVMSMNSPGELVSSWTALIKGELITYTDQCCQTAVWNCWDKLNSYQCGSYSYIANQHSFL